MIPMLILYFIKTLKTNTGFSKKINRIKNFAIRLKLIFFLFFLTGTYAMDGEENPKLLAYHVMKNNTVIGTIHVSIDALGDSTIYMLEGSIKAKYLLTFDISSKEKSVYKNGLLVYSSVYRTLNKKVKTNHSITLNKGQYDLEISNRLKVLDCDMIRSNLITLFFREPLNIKKIYADNSRKFVNVTSMGQGMYKVHFSNWKYNIFHYKNGKCIRIDAISSLFNVTLIKV